MALLMSISNSVRRSAVKWAGQESERLRSMIVTEDVECKASYNQSLNMILFDLDFSTKKKCNLHCTSRMEAMLQQYFIYYLWKLCSANINMHINACYYEWARRQLCFCAHRKLTAMATNTPPIRTSQLCCFHAIRYVWERNITHDWHIMFDCVTV